MKVQIYLTQIKFPTIEKRKEKKRRQAWKEFPKPSARASTAHASEQTHAHFVVCRCAVSIVTMTPH
jgi:hypothetical protein